MFFALKLIFSFLSDVQSLWQSLEAAGHLHLFWPDCSDILLHGPCLCQHPERLLERAKTKTCLKPSVTSLKLLCPERFNTTIQVFSTQSVFITSQRQVFRRANCFTVTIWSFIQIIQAIYILYFTIVEKSYDKPCRLD